MINSSSSFISIEHLAVLGVTFRTAPTQIRAILSQADEHQDAPSQQLIQAGYAQGICKIETCSRIEWILSAKEAKWCAEILKASLIKQMQQRHPEWIQLQHQTHCFHIKIKDAALDYIFRIATGLDSLVEGESAVSRQILQAFQKAHQKKQIDQLLGHLWNHTGKLVHQKRKILPQKTAVGIERLVSSVISQTYPHTKPGILVFGTGEIGRTIFNFLKAQDYQDIKIFNRKTKDEFMQAVVHSPIVIIASGAPESWFSLPKTELAKAYCIDIGSPTQTFFPTSKEKECSSWTLITLDEILAHQKTELPDCVYAQVKKIIEQEKECFKNNIQYLKKIQFEDFSDYQLMQTSLVQTIGSQIEDKKIQKILSKYHYLKNKKRKTIKN